MAIKVYDRYGPRANPADSNYPNGSYKNESVPGADDGTPLESAQPNDLQGFTDALLDNAGINPSGNPDTKNNSDRLNSILTLKYLSSGSTNSRRISDRFADMLNVFDYGLVPDYSGTPLYDGLDGGRVTATDNTQGLLLAINEALSTGKTIFANAGHYGFTTGNLNIDLQGKTITIQGEGSHNTIFDYIFEDNTKTSTVTIDTCNAICKFTNGKVILKDIRVKGTTNLLNVNGNQNPDDQPDVYLGSVWGMTLKGLGFDLHNVETDHFNFRGITCQPAGPLLVSEVNMHNCVGHNCVASGYWWRLCNVNVYGGEFYRNGRPGTIHTGYGVLCEEGCENVYVTNATFKENCRKGLDSRAVNTTVTYCNFIDNRLKDFDLQQKVAGSDKNILVFSNNTIQYNLNKDFINLCDSQYTSLGGTGNLKKVFISASESNENITLFGTGILTNNTVSTYSGGQSTPTDFAFSYLNFDKVVFTDNSIDLSGINVRKDGLIRDTSFMFFGKDNAIVDFNDNNVRIPSISRSGDLYNGVTFIVPPSGVFSEFNMLNNNFDISNQVLFARDIGNEIGGNASDFGLKAAKNTVRIRDLKFGVSPSAIKTNSLDWVNIESFFFSRNESTAENKIIIGEYEYSVSGGSSIFSYGNLGSKVIRKQGNTSAGDEIFRLLVPNTGGEINVRAQGTGSVFDNEIFTSYAASTLTRTDHKTSSAIAAGDIVNFNIGGSSMNLLAIPFTSPAGISEQTFIVSAAMEGTIGSDCIAGAVV